MRAGIGLAGRPWAVALRPARGEDLEPVALGREGKGAGKGQKRAIKDMTAGSGGEDRGRICLTCGERFGKRFGKGCGGGG